MQRNFKTTVMETQFVYEKLTDMSVELNTQPERNMCVLRGRALLNENESRFSFVQNPPRGARSVEVGRTAHSRYVRRPDGLYTLTVRFDAGEKMLLPALLSEMRAVVKGAIADKEMNRNKEMLKKREEEEK